MSSPFPQFRIRTKILGGFGMVLLVTIGLGGFAMQRMSAMNTGTEAVTQNYLPSGVILGKMQFLLQKIRTQCLQQLLFHDSGAKDVAEKKINQLDAAYDQARRNYEPLIDPGEESERFKQIDRLWPKYMEGGVAMIEASGRNDAAAALALYNGASRETFSALSASFDQEVEYNHSGGVAAGEHEATIYRATVRVMYGVMGVAALATMLIGFVLVRGISTPLGRMTAAMRRLAAGEMDVEIPGVGREDEIGAMAVAVQVFKQSMIQAERLTAEQEVAKVTAAATQKAALIQTANAFEASVGGLVSMLASGANELQATARSMSATATQTNQQASTVAAASGQASIGVQTVAAAAEELSSSIHEINRQILQSARITERAVTDARRTNVTVRALADGAQSIGDVVQLISNIAAQTNLLALNATIEAARAGDAGKGFAVVASEVKSLASQTAKATQDISVQVAQIQNATAEAVQAISAIGSTIEEVSLISSTIAAAVEEQGAATAEIARNVQQTAARTQEVSDTIGGVSQAADSTGTAAEEVLGAAGELSRQAEQLTSEVHRFVAGVRAA